VLVSHSRRLLFIHMPKTGGMSMTGALKKVDQFRIDIEAFGYRF
jgi:hypothetical protein